MGPGCLSSLCAERPLSPNVPSDWPFVIPGTRIASELIGRNRQLTVEFGHYDLCPNNHAIDVALSVRDRLLHSGSRPIWRLAVTRRALNGAWHDTRDPTNGSWGAQDDPFAAAIKPDLAACIAGFERAASEPDRGVAARQRPAATTTEYSATWA